MALDELRRAEIIVHTRYPDPGPAYPIGMGLFAGLYPAAFALPGAAMIAAFVVIGAVATVLIRIYVNRRGAVPDARKAPSRLRREMVIVVVAYLAITATAMILWATTSWLITSLAAAGATYVATEIYARRFARAARMVESEAGIEPLVAA